MMTGCSTSSSSQELPIEVNFSPHGGVTDAIVREINSAHKTVFVQAFSCTSVPIGEALIAAHDRKVDVEVVLDRENLGNPNSLLKPLFQSGIKVYIDDKHSIAHNKIMIIDSREVITGSFNFSKSAEFSNAENSLIIKNTNITAKYLVNWQLHKSHSYVYGN